MRQERWHVGKEIPIAIIAALLAQTGGWIWWAATQSAKLDTLTNMVSEFKANQYTQGDANRDKELVSARFKDLDRRVTVIEDASRRGQ